MGRGITKSWRFWHRTNMAEHSSAINTRGNAAAVLRQGREDFFLGARRIFCSGGRFAASGRGRFA